MDIFRYIKLSMSLLPSAITCFLLCLDARRLQGVRTFRPEPLGLILLSWTWILPTLVPKTNTICRQSPSYITKLKFRNVITTLARLAVSIKQDFRHWYWLWKKKKLSNSSTCAIECHRPFNCYRTRPLKSNPPRQCEMDFRQSIPRRWVFCICTELILLTMIWRSGDACRKFWIKRLIETNLGVAQTFCDP